MTERDLTVTEHLEELRRRLFVALAAILLATAVAFFFSDPLLKLLLLPAGGMQLKAFELMDGFMIRFRVAMYAGIVVSFPIWAYELYSYLAPGLLESERKIVFPMLFGALGLFILGMAFGYYLLAEIIRVVLKLFPPEVDLLPSADSYISFVVFFLLACGLVFQVPPVLITLVQLNLLSSRVLRKNRKFAYFILFAFAEIITPVTDPIVAPLTVTVPLVLLYEISIFFARRIESRRQRIEIKNPAY